MNTTRIICAGFGGQGIMLLGRILAETGMRAGQNVTCMPSYGAEVRGGTAHSMVIISTDEIPSPVIDETNICIIMNRPSLDKFVPRVKKGGTIILNSSLIETPIERRDIRVIKIPATETAVLLGNIKVANIVMFGALIRETKIIPRDKALDLLQEVFANKRDLLELNKKAFEKGWSLKND